MNSLIMLIIYNTITLIIFNTPIYKHLVWSGSPHLIPSVNISCKMAYVGRQVEVAREGDVAVGRVVDHVVDSRTGFVAERERIAVQVPTEDGGTAVVMGERIRAVRVVSTSLYLSTYIYII